MYWTSIFVLVVFSNLLWWRIGLYYCWERVCSDQNCWWKGLDTSPLLHYPCIHIFLIHVIYWSRQAWHSSLFIGDLHWQVSVPGYQARRPRPGEVQFVRHQWRRLHHQGRDDGHCVGHLRDDGPILRTDGRRKHHQRTRGKSISREFYSIFVYTKHCSVLRGTKQFYLI